MIRSFNSKTLHHGLPEGFRIKWMLDLGALALILGTAQKKRAIYVTA